MLIHTSISGMFKDYSADQPAGLLYDFDIDGDQLKGLHKRWLDKQVIYWLLTDLAKTASTVCPKWTIWVQGTASRPGSEEHNHRLSKRRADRVLEYLKPYLGAAPVGFEVNWSGEQLALRAGKADHLEDPWDRGVWILIQAAADPPPKHKIKVYEIKMELDPLVDHRHLPEHKSFKIRMLSASTAGRSFLLVSPKAASATFEIVDEEAKLKATYTLVNGVAGSVGIGLNLMAFLKQLEPVTIDHTGKGDWNTFPAPRSASFRNFEGPLSMDSVGVTPASKNELWFGSKRRWLNLAPAFHIPNFKTGNTWGTGASMEGASLKGMLVHVKTEPYHGD
jgi:hypothetical protein